MVTEFFTTPAGNTVELVIREGTNDHNTAWSALNENEYALGPVSGLAWDIGAHIGSVTVGLLVDNPDLRVVALEAVPHNVEMLRSNLDINLVGDRCHVHWGAAGRDGAEVRVDYGFRGSEAAEHHAYIGNSTLGAGTEHRTDTFEATSIRDLLDYGVPDLVKIDIEGGEWSFLDSAFVGQLPLIVGEWHPTDGNTIGDLIALLPSHEVTFTGPQTGPGGFRAVLR